MIVILVAALLGLLLWWYFSSDRLDWREKYTPDSTDPYGGWVMKELLSASRDSADFHILSDTLYRETRIDSFQTKGNYIFLGRQIYLDSLEIDYLLSFVEKGNSAFLISKGFNDLLVDTLINYDIHPWQEEADEGETNFWFESMYAYPLGTYNDSIIYANIGVDNQHLEQPYRARWVYDELPVEHRWIYWKSQIDSEYYTQIERLGHFNGDYLNFIRVQYGEGSFYLHTNPELFSNFHLREEECYEYFKQVFSHLKEGPIYWDEDNRYFQSAPGNSSDMSLYKASEGPLSFILGEKMLRSAWYLLLLGVLLFFLFGARRNQRVVPVMNKNENTSIEYSETVGQLYMRQGNHRSLGLLKMRLFLAFIREHYGLRTSYNSSQEKEQLIHRIALKSDLGEQNVKDIFALHQAIFNASEVSNEMLIRLHRRLEFFYNECK
ncbi:MAG: hypothetical protein HKN32_04360 [Flavobacteriales bacterium]|nr:hypothetical protein [Flavobacteriales bacterium]